MIADRACEGFSRKHDGGDIKGGFLAVFPKPGRGGTDQGLPGDAHHGGDERCPCGTIERRSRGIDFDAPILLAISRKMAAVIGFDRRRRRDDEAERYATRLETYTRQQPLDWSDFLIARGRALATWGRGERSQRLIREIERLRKRATEHGLQPAVPALDEALTSA